MLLDISTLYVMVALCSFVAGIVHLAAAAGGRFGSWANWWGGGHILLGASAMIPLGRGLGVPFLVPVGNMVAVLSYMLIYIGMRRFACRSAKIGGWFALGVVVGLPMLLWTDPAGMGGRIAYLNVVRSLLDVATVVSAIRIARRESLRTGWIVATMFVLTVPMFLGRGWMAATGRIGTEPTGMHGGPAAWLAAGAIAFIMFRGFSLLTMDAERGERRLEMLAERDGLTGAGNRTAFERARGGWRGEGAVMMIDLDRFKALNDSHGHAVGDAALCVATRAAVASVPMTGRVFRWGGDEFVCVLPGTGAQEAAVIATGIANRFVEGTGALLGTGAAATLSIGWTLGPLADVKALIADADERMYAAKRQGRVPDAQRSVAESAPPAYLISQSQHG